MDIGPVKIFTIRDVPRLRYIVELILGEILGLSWEIVTDKRKIGKNPVINYSDDVIKGSFKISPDGLLAETGLRKIEPTVKEWKGCPVFFETSDDSDIPFDIFAASFFLISRYEEYLEYVPDQYGRFSAVSSFAYKNRFLTRPVVDLWVRELAKAFLQRFQNLTFKRNVFRSMLTVDIDQPFAYLGKDILRSVGGLFNDISHHSGKAKERYRTIAKGDKDPFDVFDYIIEMISENGTDVRFFIPTGNRTAYDNNPSWQNEDYRKLITRIHNKYQVGLHPSFGAAVNPALIVKEKQRLESIISANIKLSRFHYINLRFPQSYRTLLTASIFEDYSMGFPEEPGFRASIARPFYFYDIIEEKKTALKITPFQVMDGALFKYKGLTPEESEITIAEIINETRRAGGLFVSLWHNTTLLEGREWKGWRNTFELMLKQQQQ